MADKNLQQLMEQADAFGNQGGELGDHTRDEVLKPEIVREIIYAQSGTLSVGTELVPTRQMNQKEISFAYPGSTTAEYPVAPDTLADRQRFSWKEFDMRLKRGQTRYFISDDAKLSGMADTQAQRAATEASRALARRKDENILGTLANGAFAENQFTASEAWNNGTDSSVNTMIDELWQMWESILVNTPTDTMDIQTMSVVVPDEVYTQLNRTKVINNIQQRVENYLEQTFDFQFYPHNIGRHSDSQLQDEYGVNMLDNALMVMEGEDTAIHGELSPQAAASAGVPLTEGPNREFGLGEDYLITQWFNTGIMEHEVASSGETPRVAITSGINANQ